MRTMKIFKNRTESKPKTMKEKKELIKLSSRFLSVVIAFTAAAVALQSFVEPGTVMGRIYNFIINANLAWVTLIMLAYAWRWEFTGGLAFLIAAFIYSIIYGATNNIAVVMLVAVPLTIAGILFISDGLIRMVHEEHERQEHENL